MVFDPSAANITPNGEVIPDDAPGGKSGYRLGHSRGDYEIPDVILNSYARQIKVVSIGSGISGILMSYLIQKFGENIDHVVYEKNGDIGGTWLEVSANHICGMALFSSLDRTDTQAALVTFPRTRMHILLRSTPIGPSTSVHQRTSSAI